MSVCAKFEGCAAKTIGEVGFLRVTVFFKKSTIAKFRLTVPSLMVQTLKLANMTRNALGYCILKFDKVCLSI